MSTFAELLRTKRRAAGLSQRRLAETVNVDFSYISKLENGHLPPPAAETIERLARAIACPPEEFLAAAGKLPLRLSDSLAKTGAIRFLQDAAGMNLSDDEWRKLTGALHGLRAEGSADEGPRPPSAPRRRPRAK